MKIPAEFEDILRGVELTEREKRFLRWITSWDDHTMQNMRTVVEKVRSTLSTLQAENKELRAELEQVKRALAMMWFSYINSDKEMPHSYETEALEEAERILGSWAECMPKYLRRGPKED